MKSVYLTLALAMVLPIGLFSQNNWMAKQSLPDESVLQMVQTGQYVSWQNTTESPVEMFVFNQNGQVIQFYPNLRKEWITCDLSGFAEGKYLVSIRNQEQILYMHKCVIGLEATL